MDNEHCRISPSYASCGILEVYNLSEDPERVIYSIGTHLYHPARGNPAAFVMFSGLHAEGNARVLAKCIERLFGNKGLHTHYWEVENPKTANFINWWMWEIPHEELKAWWKAKRIERIKSA